MKQLALILTIIAAAIYFAVPVQAQDCVNHPEQCSDPAPDPGPTVQHCEPANKAVPGHPSWDYWLMHDDCFVDCRTELAETQLAHNACWSYVVEKLWPEARDIYPAPAVYDLRQPLPYETGCGGVALQQCNLCAQTLSQELGRLNNCLQTKALLQGLYPY